MSEGFFDGPLPGKTVIATGNNAEVSMSRTEREHMIQGAVMGGMTSSACIARDVRAHALSLAIEASRRDAVGLDSNAIVKMAERFEAFLKGEPPTPA